MKFWLLKSEPSSYSIEDLRRDGKTAWDGVRNYQARNYIRDDMKEGDRVLFHHSNGEPAVAGLAQVTSDPYPDATQFDKASRYFDPKATKEAPRWFVVDVRFVRAFEEPITLKALREEKDLSGMVLLQRGSRLSVQPVGEKHFERILKIASGQTVT